MMSGQIMRFCWVAFVGSKCVSLVMCGECLLSFRGQNNGMLILISGREVMMILMPAMRSCGSTLKCLLLQPFRFRCLSSPVGERRLSPQPSPIRVNLLLSVWVCVGISNLSFSVAHFGMHSGSGRFDDCKPLCAVFTMICRFPNMESRFGQQLCERQGLSGVLPIGGRRAPIRFWAYLGSCA